MSLHRAVAAVVRGSAHSVLCVRRRADASDYPDVIALPTVMMLDGEGHNSALRRLGRTRLGIALEPLREIAAHRFGRAYGILQMSIWECTRSGFPVLVETALGPVFKGLLWLSIEELAAHALPDTCCALLCAHHGLAPGGSR
jgi:hypothetical protein